MIGICYLHFGALADILFYENNLFLQLNFSDLDVQIDIILEMGHVCQLVVH